MTLVATNSHFSATDKAFSDEIKCHKYQLLAATSDKNLNDDISCHKRRPISTLATN